MESLQIGNPLTVSLAEAARALGFSTYQTRGLVADGRMPHFRVGNRIRIPRDILADWVAHQAGVSLAPNDETGTAG